ncbi:MAG: Maf family protein [Oscillospiraceae bacterium]
MNLILASASPRRRELLGIFGKPFVIDPASGPENPPAGASPEETVRALAAAKAQETAARHPGDLVIGADTIVELDGMILGKPADRDDAFHMLRALSGREHRVFTGVALACGDELRCEAEMTRVFFRELSDREIWAYIDSGEPMDKAGAYGYQGLAGLFVERIEGDFFNVVGLPLCRLGRMLEAIGVTLL